MSLTPGLLLSDRYRLTHRIAVGGMGEVWAADDTRLARSVAVKILKSELTSDPEFVDRFRSEARITASLNHPGIAAVHDYGEVASIAGGPRDTAFLVMELVTGEPLSAVLARSPRLSVTRTLDVLEQSGRALQVAHSRNLVHRDIKPGNILITPTGQVKITDFGIAKVAHQVPVTRGGMVMGTAQYLSPEQAAGLEAGPASDVYALGIVAFECLAGVRPFNADNPVAVAMAQVRDLPPPLPMDVPPPVAALVMRMLAKDPARRFPDGATLARAVAGIRGGMVLPATGAAPLPPRMAPVGPPGPVGPIGGVSAVGPAPMMAAPAPVLAGPPAGYPGMNGQHTGALFPAPPPSRTAPGRSRRTGWAVLIALIVLLVIVVAGYFVLRSTGSRQPAPSGPAGTVTTETTAAQSPTTASSASPAGGAGPSTAASSTDSPAAQTSTATSPGTRRPIPGPGGQPVPTLSPAGSTSSSGAAGQGPVPTNGGLPNGLPGSPARGFSGSSLQLVGHTGILTSSPAP